MAIEHLVLIEQNDGVTEAQAQKVMDGISALKDQVPGVLSVKIGKKFFPTGRRISPTPPSSPSPTRTRWPPTVRTRRIRHC